MTAQEGSCLVLYPSILRVAFSLNLQAKRPYRQKSLTTVTSPRIHIFPISYVSASGTSNDRQVTFTAWLLEASYQIDAVSTQVLMHFGGFCAFPM